MPSPEFVCHICGRQADMEVTWPDSYVLRLCERDMPRPEPGMSFVDLAGVARRMVDDAERFANEQEGA